MVKVCRCKECRCKECQHKGCQLVCLVIQLYLSKCLFQVNLNSNKLNLDNLLFMVPNQYLVNQHLCSQFKIKCSHSNSANHQPLVNLINYSLKLLGAFINLLKYLGNLKDFLNKLQSMVSLKGSQYMVNQQWDSQLMEPLKTSVSLNMVKFKHKLCSLKKLTVQEDIK